MEFLAIVVLGCSVLLGLSTTERKPTRTLKKPYEDADWAFTDAYELNVSKAEE